jgi:glycosyltransferase involved in cell wall biosynthesis
MEASLATDFRRPVVMILTPVYNEEANLPRYEDEFSRVFLARTDVEYRVLFIDDGSQDRSWELISALCARQPRFSGLRLSRNFGPHNALSAGFGQTEADAAVVLACDLQDPPETVLEFVEQWKTGAQIVFGHRRKRDEGLLRIWTSRGFNYLLAHHAFPRDSKFSSGSFLLADRRVIECYRSMGEAQGITFAIFAWTGFRQVRVDYDRRKRQAGRSGWTLPQMFGALYDALMGYSRLPIQIFFIIGLLCLTCTLGLGAYTLLNYLLGNTKVPGWTSLVAMVNLFFGVQTLLLSIIGEYLYRIYMQTLRRPRFFVADTTPPCP